MGSAAHPVTKTETLVLFSDGTGNSSAKLFKTNVWRMYEGVDLGLSRTGDLIQIAYYDNGVGTQSIRLLAMLAGIFGFGLKANVLRLYRFACRNSTPGCTIYCFGFSRGAFTIRLVAAMLAKYGVVQYKTEAELQARTLDVFRKFMRSNNPNRAARVGIYARALRDAYIWLKRGIVGPTLERPISMEKVEVRFVGVWDTVNAYGGPIAELTRGIDDYLWPLTMTDTCLNRRVGIARHALSLDDERDAFQPVLWDEVNWGERARRRYPDDPALRQAYRDRLKQVWFAGMHSDVGGGYPDESLSYVSLYWMMEEAEAAGLRLLPMIKARVRALSNSLGPIHDSRGGLARYYRPQPRKIAAFLHPLSGEWLEPATLSLRDPVLGELPKPPHGLLLRCRVHESVVARLVEGCDDYAPATLPPRIQVEPFSASLQREGGNPVIDPAVMRRLTLRDPDWYDRQERIWDFVLYRRITYFLCVAVTVALVAMPLWVEDWPIPNRQDGRAVMQRLTSWSQYVPVNWLRPWIHAFEVNWPAFVGLAVIAAGLGWAGSVLQGKARTRSYTLWRDRIAGNPLIDRTHPRPGRVTEIRNGVRYQRALQYIKWRALPAAAAAALALVIGWLGLAAFTQYSWSRDEPTLCEASATAKPVLHVEIQRFSTSDPCMAVAKVERGHRYEIALTVTKPWTDYGVPADPIGVRRALWAAEDVKDPPLWKRMFQWLGSPYRRVVDGRYLQPVVKLRASDRQAGLLPRTSVHLLTPTTTDKVAYTDVFDANADGELFLFVNDAAVLGWRNGFYANNEGTARVTITDLDPGSVVGGIVDKPGADAKPEDAEPAVGGPKSDASRR